MKKSTTIQTIVTLTLIIVVALFGIYAFLLSNRNITSKISIDVADPNVNMKIEVNADWMENDFETESTVDGFSHSEWSMDNLELTKDNPKQKITLSITNNTISTDYNYAIKLINIAYDKNVDKSFTTTVRCSVLEGGEKVINSDECLILMPGTTQNITIEIEYELNAINCDFSLEQEIEVTVESYKVNV